MTDRVAFQLYMDYVGIKLHFNSDKYLFYKERDLKLTVDSYNKRADRELFYAVSKKYPKREDSLELLVSGFLMNRRMWILDFLSDPVSEYHVQRMKRCRAVLHFFKQDLVSLEDELASRQIRLVSALKTNGKKRPIIAEILTSKDSLAILDFCFNFTRFSTVDILWEEERTKINRYKYLLDMGEVKPYLKQHIDNLLALNRVNPTY